VRERKHDAIVDAVGIVHDGQRIAGQRDVGEDVEQRVPQLSRRT
jgi:hypothetical protein